MIINSFPAKVLNRLVQKMDILHIVVQGKTAKAKRK